MLRIFDLSHRKFVKWNENEDQKASILSMNANIRMHEKQAGVYRGDTLFDKAFKKTFLVGNQGKALKKKLFKIFRKDFLESFFTKILRKASISSDKATLKISIKKILPKRTLQPKNCGE